MVAPNLGRALRRAGGGLGGVASLLARPLVRPGRCVRLLVVDVSYLFYDYYRDEAEAFADPVQQFKYGSTGGDRLAGIPVEIFNALPKLVLRLFPGEGWKSNWATCHIGTYRDAPTASRSCCMDCRPIGSISGASCNS